MTQSSSIFKASAITAMAIALCLGFWMSLTRGRVAVGMDSVNYLYAAHSFSEGRGLMNLAADGSEVAMTHFPPLLSLCLGKGAAFGMNSVTLAKWMNRGLYAASLLVLMLLVFRQTQSLGTSLAAVAIVGTNWTFLLVHTFIFSEPLFLLFTLLCLYCVAVCVSDLNLRVIALAGVFATLAILSRYVGLFLVPVGVGICLMQVGRPLKKRVLAALMFLMAPCVGSLTWFVRNRLAGGTTADRHFVFHPVGSVQLVQLAQTASSMMPIPGRNIFVGIATLLLLMLVLVLVLALRMCIKSQAVPAVALLLLSMLSYSALLVISISTFDVDTPLDERILVPDLVFVVPVVGIWIWSILQKSNFLRGKRIICVIVGITIVGSAVKSFHHIAGMHYQMGDKAWASSATLAGCKTLPADVDVYTNRQDVVWFLTGRIGKRLPIKFNANSRVPDAHYAAGLDEMCRRVQSGGADLVFFDGISYDNYTPSRGELDARLGAVGFSYSDGVIFRKDVGRQ